jgi:hypothetical protein
MSILRDPSADLTFGVEISDAVTAIERRWRNKVPPANIIVVLSDPVNGHCMVLTDLDAEDTAEVLQAAIATVTTQEPIVEKGSPL